LNEQKIIAIKIKRLSADFEDLPLPMYATEHASGMDVRAALFEPVTIEPGGVAMIPTDFCVEIPEGHEIQVRPRSGLAAANGVTILNAPGTIDADYRGEIKIILINHGKLNFIVNRGDRIAQLVLSKVLRAEIQVSDELKDTIRGEGGFGHTGRS
jgi:dUTP pyrophosphatase